VCFTTYIEGADALAANHRDSPVQDFKVETDLYNTAGLFIVDLMDTEAIRELQG
jgi:hypothetical protein